MKTGQINLFTKRVRKPPDPLEFDIHCAIADAIRKSKTPGWVWFHPPNGGERPALINKSGKRVSVEGGRLQRMGARAGVSDIILAKPGNAQMHALEIKTRLGTPSDEQDAFLAEVKAAGGLVAVVHSVEEGLAILKSWGAIKATLGA